MPIGTQRFKPFPVYAPAYLLLCLCLKIYQLCLLAGERVPSRPFDAHLPWMAVQDAGVAVLVLMVWDVGAAGLRGRRSRLARGLAVLGQVAFSLLLIYQFFMFKFYYLFGTFLNYGLLLQADHFGSYAAGILHELDLPVAGLFVAGAVYAQAVWMMAGYVLKNSRLSGPPPVRSMPWFRRRPSAFGWTAGLLLAYAATGTVVVRFTDSRMNYCSLDKNPWFELLGTTVQAQTRKPDAACRPAPAGPGFSSASLLQPRGRSKRVVLKNLPRSQRRNLNVVFILLESLPLQYTGLQQAANRELTPQLCRLARSSLVFSQHYCQEPASLKSLHSVLTGNYSYQTRDWKSFIARAQSDRSLPELLRQRGYATVYFTSADGRIYSQNDFLGKRFDRVVDMNTLQKSGCPFAHDSASYDDQVLPVLLAEYLRSHPGKYFAFLSPYMPHHPYPAPPKEFQKNRGDTPLAHYQNSLAYADHILGQILAVLEKERLLDTTLVAVASDHGEAFYQHPGNYLHSIYLYEENVSALFMLSNPRLIRPGVVRSPSQHVDIAPTILDALGYPADGFDGLSLLKPRPLQAAFFYTTFSDQRFGLRDQAFKYIADLDYDSEELYNLETDREEQKNIAAARQDLCKKFKAKLLELREKIQ